MMAQKRHRHTPLSMLLASPIASNATRNKPSVRQM